MKTNRVIRERLNILIASDEVANSEKDKRAFRLENVFILKEEITLVCNWKSDDIAKDNFFSKYTISYFC